ncbi:MAG: pyridoxal 5'-phosphate synthase lyase subunit PdxS, partial [Candidatus Methanomethylicia archaeon]
GIFKSADPEQRAEAIVLATAYWDDVEIVAEACRICSEVKSMRGIDIRALKSEQLMQLRGV